MACDSDYRGEYIVAIHNDTDEVQVILPGDRIAQLIILPYVEIKSFEEVEDLSDTQRGKGGFRKYRKIEMYKVTIETNNGQVETGIENIEELEEVLKPYENDYTGCKAEQINNK